MAKVKKVSGNIKKEELELIVKQQTDVNNLLIQLGTLEGNKHVLLHKLDNVNKTVEDTKQVLEDSYGPININLEDGSYTVIEKEEE